MSRRVGLMISTAVLGLLLVPAGSAAYPARVLVRTEGPIAALALDPSGRAAWIQLHNPPSGCYQVRRGDVRLGQDLALGPCHPNASGSQRVATTISDGKQRVVWAYSPFGGNTTTSTTLWAATNSGGSLTRLASTSVSCGDGCWAPGGTETGPLAARDGVVLYSVAVIQVAAGCDGSCGGTVSGGRIRSVSFDAAGGAHVTTVAGAPPAVFLATAGGMLADLPYAIGAYHAAGTIELRRVSDGKLLATIPVTGTVGAMAMSRTQLAVIVTDGQGTHHLVRFAVPSGTRLGSIPLANSPDVHSLGIWGERIVYQTAHAVRVYRVDLGRSTTIHRQDAYRSNLSIDHHGVRWTVRRAAGASSAIMGVELRPLP